MICTEAGQYVVEGVDGLSRDFGVPEEGFVGVCPLQRLEERNGNWHGLYCHYQWQGSGTRARVIRHWTDDGESYQFEYHLIEQTSRVVDQSGRVQHWQWNADQQPTAYTDAEGHLWQYAWNEHRQLLSSYKVPVILTHFPETWENLRALPGFSVIK